MEHLENVFQVKKVEKHQLKTINNNNKYNFFTAHLLISTGTPYDQGKHSEIIDLSNFKDFNCSEFADVPWKFQWCTMVYADWINKYTNTTTNKITPRSESVGGLIQGEPIICGGLDNNGNILNDCIVIGNPNFKKINMLEKRSAASGVVLNETLWIVGGWNGGQLSSTELITICGSKKYCLENRQGPDLPFTITHHCMIQVS